MEIELGLGSRIQERRDTESSKKRRILRAEFQGVEIWEGGKRRVGVVDCGDFVLEGVDKILLLLSGKMKSVDEECTRRVGKLEG